MAVEITMPKLVDSMENGTVSAWLKSDGDQIEVGDELVEIETDKATIAYEAEATGMLKIAVREGATVPVGAPIARLVAGDEAPTEEPRGHQPEETFPVLEPALSVAPSPAARKATPLARRAAHLHNIALDSVIGSGILGRVTLTDVLEKAGVRPHFAQADATFAPSRAGAINVSAAGSPMIPDAAGDKGDTQLVDLTRLQSLVARRMTEAKATIPHFQIQAEVSMDALIAFREQIKAVSDTVPSLNDLVVKAAALAAREHPLANGSFEDGHVELHSRVNIGIAVASDRALVVPTIFDADQKSFGVIAAESRRLAGSARDGSIKPSELGGATFTVSNLGMYGISAITPIINPPQAAILGVGAIREVLMRVDDKITDAHLVTLTLSCDHRILYGAEAAEFLSTIRRRLEQPIRLAL